MLIGKLTLSIMQEMKIIFQKILFRREKYVVTPVKNQLSCGACWAFSTVETVESMYALATGKLKELSTQQV